MRQDGLMVGHTGLFSFGVFGAGKTWAQGPISRLN